MQHTFEILDYVIFIITLSFSVIISLNFGCFGNKQKQANVYLYGSKNFSSIPIGLSLLSSAISSLAVVGTVQEIYMFGTQILLNTAGIAIGLIITWKVILPVFYGTLNLKGPYEYFERRYDTKVRLLLSALYLLHYILFSAILLYVSTISFSEASGLNIYLCTTVIGITCTVYTLLGGFAGVIWTDVLQTVLMFSSCLFIMVKGINISGGFPRILYEADKGQRVQLFNLDPNPFVRLTLWSAMLGMCVINVAHSSCAASGIQRFMALRTEKEARISTAINVVGFIIMYWISGIIALSVYVYYKDCDPISAKKINNPSQLLAYFINDITGNTKGFAGLFTAGLLCAGLSSLSAELNTVSGLFYYDIMIKMFKFPYNEKKATMIMKLIILFYGILCTILAPFLHKFKYIYQFGFTFCSWTYGAKFGIMILATCFPQSNSWGAFWGVIISVITIAATSMKAMFLDVSSEYALPSSIENCTEFGNNFTNIMTTNQTLLLKAIQPSEFSFFKLSYMFYSVFGAIITITVGLIVSYITGVNDVNQLEPGLVISCLRPGHNKKHWWNKFWCKKTEDYTSVSKLEL